MLSLKAYVQRLLKSNFGFNDVIHSFTIYYLFRSPYLISFLKLQGLIMYVNLYQMAFLTIEICVSFKKSV
jgi:hypothetical protein